MTAAADAWTRIGVFGGTFDPPHVGHLLVAGDAAEELRLDKLLWLPALQQPLKTAAPPSADAAARLRMVELTVSGDPRFAVETMELERDRLSFTVETLSVIRERYPAAELFLLVGEDAWRTFPAWRDPARIRQLAEVVVLARRGGTETVPGSPEGGAPLRLETRRVEVSATEIRKRVRDGLPIRGFVTEAVERLIMERGLYRD